MWFENGNATGSGCQARRIVVQFMALCPGIPHGITVVAVFSLL
jgi:hypothetical protein